MIWKNVKFHIRLTFKTCNCCYIKFFCSSLSNKFKFIFHLHAFKSIEPFFNQDNPNPDTFQEKLEQAAKYKTKSHFEQIKHKHVE